MWDARFQVVSFLTPLGHSRVTSGVTGADVTFRTAWQDAVPLNDGQSLVGPGICPKPSDQPRDAAQREECSDLDEKSFTTLCHCGRAKRIC